MSPGLPLIPLGTFCLTALCLKRAGLRKYALPLDYTFTPLSAVEHLLHTRFELLLDKQQLTRGSPIESHPHNHTSHRRYGERFFWHHDLFDDTVYQSFSRRKERMLQALNQGATTVTMLNSCEYQGAKVDETIKRIQEALRAYNSQNRLALFILEAGPRDGIEIVHSDNTMRRYLVTSGVTRSDSSVYITDGSKFESPVLEEMMSTTLRHLWAAEG